MTPWIWTGQIAATPSEETFAAARAKAEADWEAKKAEVKNNEYYEAISYASALYYPLFKTFEAGFFYLAKLINKAELDSQFSEFAKADALTVAKKYTALGLPVPTFSTAWQLGPKDYATQNEKVFQRLEETQPEIKANVLEIGQASRSQLAGRVSPERFVLADLFLQMTKDVGGLLQGHVPGIWGSTPLETLKVDKVAYDYVSLLGSIQFGVPLADAHRIADNVILTYPERHGTTRAGLMAEINADNEKGSEGYDQNYRFVEGLSDVWTALKNEAAKKGYKPAPGASGGTVLALIPGSVLGASAASAPGGDDSGNILLALGAIVLGGLLIFSGKGAGSLRRSPR